MLIIVGLILGFSFVYFFNEKYYLLNTSESPLYIKDESDFKKINFSLAKNLFRRSFGNPAEFTIVIVGDFNIKDVEPWIVTYLSSITPQKNIDPWPLKLQK